MARIGYVTIDCADVESQLAFWAQALRYQRPEGPWDLLRDPEHGGVPIYLQRVPEPKATKNRVHLDLVALDPQAEIQRLVDLGATHVADRREGGIAWSVLQDPEGNEFCLFPATAAGEQ